MCHAEMPGSLHHIPECVVSLLTEKMSRKADQQLMEIMVWCLYYQLCSLNNGQGLDILLLLQYLHYAWRIKVGRWLIFYIVHLQHRIHRAKHVGFQ